MDQDAILEQVRARVIIDPVAYTEAIWKDPKGVRVKCHPHHVTILRFLEKARLANIPALVLAPMGSGKTELGMSFFLRLLDLDPFRRLGIVGDMDEHAAQRVRTIRRYIENDDDHKRLFPDTKIHPDRTSTNKVFSTTVNRYAKDESVEASGVKSSGTGSRKDGIFFDDCVTEANALVNPGDRPRVISGFQGTWLTRIEPQVGWWYYIGTPYTADDLTHVLMENKDIALLKISVSEDFSFYEAEEKWPGDEKVRKFVLPLWEGKWDEKAYRKRFGELVTEGEATKWYSGYRNMVIDPTMARFRKPWFQRTVVSPDDWARWRFRVLYADPASSQEKTADFYAGVVLGWDPGRKAAVVLHKWKVREPLTDRINRYLEAAKHYTPIDDGVEGKHELSFREALKREAAEQRVNAKVRAINHGPDAEKIARISSIAPLIENGKIIFDGAQHPEFWDEAALFPRAKHDDLLDALQGAWSMLRKIMWRNGAVPRIFDPDKHAVALERKGQAPRYKVPPMQGRYRTMERNARNLLWGEQ